MFRRFQIDRDGISLFWEIATDGDRVVVRSGNVGSFGTTQARRFLSEWDGKQEATRLIAQRLQAGWSELEVGENERPDFVKWDTIEYVDAFEEVEVEEVEGGDDEGERTPDSESETEDETLDDGKPRRYIPPTDYPVIDGAVVIPEEKQTEVVIAAATLETSVSFDEPAEPEEIALNDTTLPISALTWGDLPSYVPLVLGDENGFVSEKDGYNGLEQWLLSPTFGAITSTRDALARRLQWQATGTIATWTPPSDGYFTGLYVWSGPDAPRIPEHETLSMHNTEWAWLPSADGIVAEPHGTAAQVYEQITKPIEAMLGAPLTLVIPMSSRITGEGWFARMVDAVEQVVTHYDYHRMSYPDQRNATPDLVAAVLRQLPIEPTVYNPATVADAVLAWFLRSDRMRTPGRPQSASFGDSIETLPPRCHAVKFNQMLNSMERSGWVVVRDACCGEHAAESIREIREWQPELIEAPVYVLIGEDAQSRWSPTGAINETQRCFSRTEAHMLMVAAKNAVLPAENLSAYGENLVYLGALPDVNQSPEEYAY